MSERNWTPEPWAEDGSELKSAGLLDEDNPKRGREILCYVHRPQNRRRILSCVNACAPIGKPEKLGELLRAAQSVIEQRVSQIHPEAPHQDPMEAFPESTRTGRLLRAFDALDIDLGKLREDG